MRDPHRKMLFVCLFVINVARLTNTDCHFFPTISTFPLPLSLQTVNENTAMNNIKCNSRHIVMRFTTTCNEQAFLKRFFFIYFINKGKGKNVKFSL